jgi:hypothetical protein
MDERSKGPGGNNRNRKLLNQTAVSDSNMATESGLDMLEGRNPVLRQSNQEDP